MSTGRSTVTLYSAVAGGAILVGVVLFAPWPLWISLAPAAVLGAGLLFVTRSPGRRLDMPPRPNPVFGEEFSATEGAKRRRVTDVQLPTSLPDYAFLFSATVVWKTTSVVTDESAFNLEALAVDAVLQRARKITERRDPSHASLVRHELAGALGEMRTDATGRLRAMAESVQLVLPARDQERLDKLAAVRKEEAVWEHERKYELNKREYLGEDVLKTPGSAVVWWLARNDDQVEKTVRDIGLLAQLSSAANNTNVPEEFHSFISTLAAPNGHAGPNGSAAAFPPSHEASPGDLVEAFLQAVSPDGDDPRRRLIGRQVAEWVAERGWHDLAEELSRRYDPPADPDPAEEADDGS
ncbi:hypothetical protein Acsp04_37200 [Actinomadura sp. NBRC 104425]|uniref:NfeD family protein n=1 Tax=Actinomadura sp. NBRC 104425 TaxID=3032204 RepID=UPI0024A2EDF7|nr:hypothetical protein [Actinomadura sp. NBRC 104425]GLZ13485.1 hypothetical protein Acsp04_37200 [Actinomadura sp. NBRC 104425]